MEDEKKFCPFISDNVCESCRLFVSIAGQQKECQMIAMSRQLFMLYAKGAADSVPGRH